MNDKRDTASERNVCSATPCASRRIFARAQSSRAKPPRLGNAREILKESPNLLGTVYFPVVVVVLFLKMDVEEDFQMGAESEQEDCQLSDGEVRVYF